MQDVVARLRPQLILSPVPPGHHGVLILNNLKQLIKTVRIRPTQVRFNVLASHYSGQDLDELIADQLVC